MNTGNYTASFLTDKTPKEVFDATKNFRKWWSEDIEGNTDQLGETFFYHYKDVHLCKMKLIESIPCKRLVYLVLDNQFSFTKDKEEWKNTQLVFEISEEENKTRLKFTHEGLTPKYECYKICEDAWSNYIKNSLFQLVENGKGTPNPKEGVGFNAEIVEKWKLK